MTGDKVPEDHLHEEGIGQMSSAELEPEQEGRLSQSPDGEPPLRRCRTTLSHQGYTLIGFAFVVFEMCFLTLYTNTFWFDTDLVWLGAPAAILAMVIAHFILIALEDRVGCLLLASIWKKRPPLVYRKWVRINEPGWDPGITFGERHIIWNCIDEIELTFWGNLQFISQSVSGKRDPSPKWAAKLRLLLFKLAPREGDVILKVPFGIASGEDQQALLAAIKYYRKDVNTNAKLSKRVEAPTIKGTIFIQQLGVIFLFLVLMDVGQSMFNYLEMVKGYYCTCLSMQSDDKGRRQTAQKYFQRAEDLREHPLPFSWVSIKIMREGKIASGLFQDRAEALWALDEKDKAIESEKKSLELSPNDYRHNLRLARMLEEAGHRREAVKQIEEAMDSRKSAFLPRLYRLAQLPPHVRKRFYKLYLNELDDRLFGTELPWPPGGETFLQDVWYRDDVTFVFERLLKQQEEKGKEAR